MTQDEQGIIQKAIDEGAEIASDVLDRFPNRFAAYFVLVSACEGIRQGLVLVGQLPDDKRLWLERMVDDLRVATQKVVLEAARADGATIEEPS